MVVAGASAYAQAPIHLGLFSNTARGLNASQNKVDVGETFQIRSTVRNGSRDGTNAFTFTGVTMTIIYDPNVLELLTPGADSNQSSKFRHTTPSPASPLNNGNSRVVDSWVKFQVGDRTFVGYSYTQGGNYTGTNEDRRLGNLSFRAKQGVAFGTTTNIYYLNDTQLGVPNTTTTPTNFRFLDDPDLRAQEEALPNSDGQNSLNMAAFYDANGNRVALNSWTNLRMQVTVPQTQVADLNRVGFTMGSQTITVVPGPPAALVFAAGGALPMFGLLRRRFARRK
jgi:hypothetical protein